ncbi:hypothetical protein [Natribacillus halophilus]|uniref:Uncharacterized protein n=1 Tax=Natribacillus halophilus TaxID=549003 RepID=A0A1G8PG45_9BACI|nr:hypothetical protein [Natribacillus halophilus]SDI91504.1 hypothetical protein SAMN04488123_108127 [Natribacillus halophilus]
MIMGFAYTFVGTLFVGFAIIHVQLQGWGIIPYLFLGLAALDYIIAWNTFKKRTNDKQGQQ